MHQGRLMSSNGDAGRQRPAHESNTGEARYLKPRRKHDRKLTDV